MNYPLLIIREGNSSFTSSCHHGQLMSCVINGHFTIDNNTGLQNVRYHKLFYMSNRIFFIPSHQDIFYRMTRF